MGRNVFASTNKDLKREVETNRFRWDLYYRLNVFPIEIAPLLHRKEDIPALAGHFLEMYRKKMNRPRLKLTKANILELKRFDWPGNVRELQNIIERAVIISTSNKLILSLPSIQDGERPRGIESSARSTKDDSMLLTAQEMKKRERDNVLAALRKSDGRIYGKTGAAEFLDVKPTTLSYRIKKMGIIKSEIFSRDSAEEI
ncbi:MAG: hypothetical protein GY866_18345 [Proteobacteria bacterium]|nr:hypothetical protein [Pseudomonadota bacterium]